MFESYSDDELRGLDPDLLTEYLVNAGWTFEDNYGPSAYVYRAMSGNEVLVPTLTDTRLYPSLVRDLLESVADESGSDGGELFHNIRYARHDIARLRAETSDSRHTLQPAAFQDLVKGAKLIWESVVSKTLGAKSEKNRQYWESAGFGQTEPGSFVVTMFSPPVNINAQLGLEPEDQEVSDARLVTDAMSKSITATRAALTDFKMGNSRAFHRENAEGTGITRATCEGLRFALTHFLSVGYHVTRSLSPTSGPTPTESVVFNSGDAEPLKSASDIIERWDFSDREYVDLSGYIIGTNRNLSDEDGKVTMKAQLPYDRGGELHTIMLFLGDDQYDLASRSHSMRNRIDAIGVLEQTSTDIWLLRDATISERESVRNGANGQLQAIRKGDERH